MFADLLTNDWTGLAAMVIALTGLWKSWRADQRQTKCEEHLKKLRDRVVHTTRHLRMLDRVLGKAVPDNVWREIAEELDKLITDIGDVPDDLEANW